MRTPGNPVAKREDALWDGACDRRRSGAQEFIGYAWLARRWTFALRLAVEADRRAGGTVFQRSEVKGR